MPGEPIINPYNFVPIAEKAPDRASFPGWLCMASEGYSGLLNCELEALTPLFSANHKRATPESATDKRLWFPFLRNSQDKPILQGTTVKGMVRAVYEAISNSCLPLVAASGTSKKAGHDVDYGFSLQPAHSHGECRSLDKLCPTCCLFGVIQGDEVHTRGRLIFTDAVLCYGQLEKKQIYLKELSSPKPHHYPIYSKTQQRGGQIVGRKFFYHHAPHADLGVDPAQWSTRAHGVTEVAPVGTRFAFTVRFDNLTKMELACLVRALVLDEDLGHKVGMGKPIGFGSCRIHIKTETSVLHKGGSRYKQWNASPFNIDVEAYKTRANAIPSALREVLRLNKHLDGAIGYLSFHAYEPRFRKG